MPHRADPRFLAFFAFLAVQSLCAQTASLRGQVTDESGALVPGAQVTLIGTGSSVRSTKTDDSGNYAFTGMLPGDYSVEALEPQLSQDEPKKIALSRAPRL